jgi:secreted trypsin-like serine protease
MRRERMRWMAGAALLLSACGEMPIDGQDEALAEAGQAIINGTACGEGEEPTTVGILVDMKLQSNFFGTVPVRTLVCTGTLIAPDTVMAAAHCVDEATLSSVAGVPATVKDAKFSITFQRDLTELVEAASTTGAVAFPADAIAVRKAVPNPDFTLEVANVGPTKTNDTAVLFLEQTAPVAPEVVITREEAAQLAVGKLVKIAGYGQQTVTSRFQQPPPGTVGVQMCAETTINELGTHEMQIGNGTSTGRKCQGDSGGPTFMTVETGTFNKRRVIGITSHSYDQTNCQKGGIDVRVDAYLDWLDQQMTAACNDGTRVWCDVPGVVPPEFWEPKPVDPGSAGDADKGCGCDAAGQVGLAGLAGLLRRDPGALSRGCRRFGKRADVERREVEHARLVRTDDDASRSGLVARRRA